MWWLLGPYLVLVALALAFVHGAAQRERQRAQEAAERTRRRLVEVCGQCGQDDEAA